MSAVSPLRHCFRELELLSYITADFSFSFWRLHSRADIHRLAVHRLNLSLVGQYLKVRKVDIKIWITDFLQKWEAVPLPSLFPYGNNELKHSREGLPCPGPYSAASVIYVTCLFPVVRCFVHSGMKTFPLMITSVSLWKPVYPLGEMSDIIISDFRLNIYLFKKN